MSAKNYIAIYAVKRKLGHKSQVIYIVKYMQVQPDVFSVRNLKKLLVGSAYTTNFNTACSLAGHILKQVSYSNCGIIGWVVCRKYKNMIISTDEPVDSHQSMLTKLPCFDPKEFFSQLECWAERHSTGWKPCNPADALFLQMLNLPELQSSREYWIARQNE